MVAKIVDAADFSAVLEVAENLRAGATVIAQTDTNFGVFCSPFSETACARLYEMKGRTAAKPLSLFVGGSNEWSNWAYPPEGVDVQSLVSSFWPGPLNIILRKKAIIPDWVTSGQNTVAIVHNESVPVNLLSIFSGLPLAATSANLSGTMESGLVDFKIAFEHIGDSADYILNSKKVTETTMSSTIISLVDGPKIVRQGDLSAAEILKVVPNLEY